MALKLSIYYYVLKLSNGSLKIILSYNIVYARKFQYQVCTQGPQKSYSGPEKIPKIRLKSSFLTITLRNQKINNGNFPIKQNNQIHAGTNI